MATRPKRLASPSPPPPRKKPSRPASKRSAPASRASKASKPFLRFYHSEELRAKTLTLLDTLEGAVDPTAHRSALADLVVELSNSGLNYYLIRPLKLANAGFIVEQSASLGLSGALQVIGSVIRNILGRMDKRQLLSVCGSIRELMV